MNLFRFNHRNIIKLKHEREGLLSFGFFLIVNGGIVLLMIGIDITYQEGVVGY
jgi:hypothetical protein